MSTTIHRGSSRTEGMKANVWSTLTPETMASGAVNLGQGFPTFFPPSFILEAFQKASSSPLQLMNQYTRSQGHPRLVNALAKRYSEDYDRELDPMTEILVTLGATEGLYTATQGLLGPGDEVILMEPFYDSYHHQTLLAGATPVYIPLRPSGTEGGRISSDWKMNWSELRAAIKPGVTKAIMFNNPHNPLGKVWEREELIELVSIAKEADVIIFSDEVYERIVFEKPHIPLATIPGAWDRTITFGSAGKSFSVTGWKTGWIIGPSDLIEPCWHVHQYIPFCCPTPIQEAVAECFEVESNHSYFGGSIIQDYSSKRKLLLDLLNSYGLDPCFPEGGYFVYANTGKWKSIIQEKEGLELKNDMDTFRWGLNTLGVGWIPPSIFYSQDHAHLASDWSRWSFCKTEQQIAEAETKLEAYFGSK